jgi:hypothetical protein
VDGAGAEIVGPGGDATVVALELGVVGVGGVVSTGSVLEGLARAEPFESGDSAAQATGSAARATNRATNQVR